MTFNPASAGFFAFSVFSMVEGQMGVHVARPYNLHAVILYDLI